MDARLLGQLRGLNVSAMQDTAATAKTAAAVIKVTDAVPATAKLFEFADTTTDVQKLQPSETLVQPAATDGKKSSMLKWLGIAAVGITGTVLLVKMKGKKRASLSGVKKEPGKKSKSKKSKPKRMAKHKTINI